MCTPRVGAGCHVLCEKPLAPSLDQARAMVDAAAGAGVVMATNHHLRNSPVIRALRGLVADGALGRVLGVRVAHTNLLPDGCAAGGWAARRARASSSTSPCTTSTPSGSSPGWRCWKSRRSGWRRGCRALDAVAVAGRLGGVDRADATLHLHDAFTTPHARTAFEVFGTTASALATDAMSQTPDGEVVLRRADAEDVLVDVGERENLYVRGLRAFAEAVAGHGDPPCTGEDGVRSLAGGARRRRVAADRKTSFAWDNRRYRVVSHASPTKEMP